MVTHWCSNMLPLQNSGMPTHTWNGIFTCTAFSNIEKGEMTSLIAAFSCHRTWTSVFPPSYTFQALSDLTLRSSATNSTHDIDQFISSGDDLPLEAQRAPRPLKACTPRKESVSSSDSPTTLQSIFGRTRQMEHFAFLLLIARFINIIVGRRNVPA